MARTIVCIGGRCSSWGQDFKKHIYDGSEDCLRCGMNRKEQWEEDKAAGLVTGAYKPYIPAEPKPITSKKIMYCAQGEEGLEYIADTRKECQAWIDEQLDQHRHETFFDPDYYQIVKFTKAEIAVMPEV